MIIPSPGTLSPPQAKQEKIMDQIKEIKKVDVWESLKSGRWGLPAGLDVVLDAGIMVSALTIGAMIVGAILAPKGK
jgi:hypothetical protein